MWNKQAFQMLAVRSVISFPIGIGAKSRNYVGLGKEQFAGHVSEYLCKWLDWVYRYEDFTFHFTSSSFKRKHHQQVNNIYKIHVNFYAFRLLALYLFITHPCFFFIFHRVVRKPFKFVNNVLQINESLINELNFPSFLSFCVFILGRHLGKCPNNFRINININAC